MDKVIFVICTGIFLVGMAYLDEQREGATDEYPTAPKANVK